MIKLAIIGGGPAGYVAAERAGAAGLSVTLFEKRELGGVCLNEGCIPTKTLLYSAKVYDTARQGDKYGVFIDGARIDFAKIMDRKNRVMRRLVGGIGVKMRNANVNVVKGEATIAGRTGAGFSIACNGETFEAENVLLCTGSETFVPPIPGLQEAGDTVITSREILSLKEQPARLAIIGGGVIGMEFVSLYNSLGSEVTVIEMLPEILTGMDTEQAAMLRDIYARRGVKFNLSCRVTEIQGNKVVYVDAEGNAASVEADKILVSVGRRAVTTGIGLETLGVEMVKGGVKVDDRMRTSVPGLWAAGDVKGFSMLAHTASREGEVVVNNLLGRDDRMRYDAIPGVVYSNPEIAGVGLTEEAAKAKGIAYRLSSLPMSYSGRFMAENDSFSGSCKVLAADDGKVLGVHMLGNPASELVHGACIAIDRGMTAAQLEEVVFPHPTVSEIFKDALFAL